ncbi:MAG: alpha/beta hydrolase [Bacteroidetes bacterium]|nr:MAG: alpha/beta hydrolase [Bacteroidota bacterium]
MNKAICILKLLEFLIFCAIIILPNETHAQIVVDNIEIESYTYKTRGLSKLELSVFQPANKELDKNLPAIIFFHGGGLRERSIWEFRPQSKYLVDRGMVAVVATYRVKRHGRTIFESIADAKSAIRWIRERADDLGIDENRIAAGGGSAGGYLAACSALIKDYDEPDEDLSISSIPNALVLFNPRLVLPVIGDPPLNKKEIRYLDGRNVEEISPVHNVYNGAPPTIIFQGTADKGISLIESQWFCEEMDKYGNKCEVELYEGREHGFFKYFSGNNPDFFSTMETTVKFLSKLAYISQDKQ